MEPADYLRFLFALVFVIGLIGGTAWLARRFGIAPGAATGGARTARRLEIVESLALDPKRRMMIVRRDGTEHLILLGDGRETVVENGFAAPVGLAAPAPATTAQAAHSEADAAPHADDDVFARLRKVAELMNERRALPRPPRPSGEPPRRASGGESA